MSATRSIYWPCDSEDFTDDHARHSMQAGVQDLAKASTPWDISRARNLVHLILLARSWDQRLTMVDGLINELLIQRCGCPMALATAAVEYEWNDKSSDFARALVDGGQRAFVFLKQIPASPSPKLTKSQQRRERAKKTRAAYATTS